MAALNVRLHTSVSEVSHTAPLSVEKKQTAVILNSVNHHISALRFGDESFR